LRGQRAGFGAIRLCAGFHSAWQVDCERRVTLGPLSVAGQSERSEPAAGHRQIRARCGFGPARFIRPRVSDPGIREYFVVQLSGSGRTQSECPAASCATFPGKLLRSGTHKRIRWAREARRQVLPPECGEFCRRRSTAEYRRQLSDRVSEVLDLWGGGEAGDSASREPQRIRQLFLHGGVDVLARDGRTLPWRQCHKCAEQDRGTFLEYAGSTQHGTDAISIFARVAAVGGAWRGIRKRAARGVRRNRAASGGAIWRADRGAR